MSRALIPSPGGSPVPGVHSAGDAPKPGENPLLLVHKLLRGRYWLAILLAAVLGPIGAVAGYKAVSLEYTSNSTIRILPVLPKILFDNDQNSMMPMFDSFLQTQVSLLSSRRVIQMAMESDTWRKAGGEYSIEELSRFEESLSVVQPKKSQLIIVGFTDNDPSRAKAATEAVVAAYMKVFGESDLDTQSHRFQILDDRAKALGNQILEVNKQIQEVALEFGSDDLSAQYEYEWSNQRNLKAELDAAKLQLNALEAMTGETGTASLDYSKLTVTEIALMDGRMQTLVDERNRLQREIKTFESTLRRPESRPEYKRAVDALKAQESEIESYAEAYRSSPLLSTRAADESGAFSPTISAAQLRSKVAGLEGLLEKAATAALDIGKKNSTLKSLRADLARLEDSLDLVNSRIEQLDLEGQSAVGGRTSVLSQAEMPTSPSNGKRRKQFLILGGLAGAGLGVGLVLALGYLRTHIRDIEDAQDIKPRLLGALPLLPDSLSNLDEALSAAQCVHHIRTILHAHMPPQEPLSLTITAANSGAGKTSFALSLGLSFASAGTRTLIIDGDMMGAGLTRRTGASGRRKLGHVLRRYEVITEEESQHALQVARLSGRRIGQALLELGYISESDLNDGLSMQQDAGLGLVDALGGEHCENCLANIGVPNLTILPASRLRSSGAHATSPVAFRRVLEELRPSFDVILIDSGPVPGTTDATVMATCADGVIMVASRGDDGSDVQRALHHLQDLQVPVVGLVFNRAEAKDIERSKYSSSAASSSSGKTPSSGHQNVQSPPDMEELLEPVPEVGPLPQSVWLSTMNHTTISESGVPV